MKSLRRLWDYLKPYKTQLIIAALMLVFSVAMVAMAPLVEGFVTTQLLSDVQDKSAGLIEHVNYSKILQIMAALFSIYTANTIARFVLQYLLSGAIQSATYDLRMAVKRKMSRLPIAYYDKHTAGDLMSTISTDVEVISNAVQQSFSAIIQAILTITVSVIMMFVLNTTMALIAVFVIPLTLISSKFIISKSQNLFKDTQDALADLNSVVQEKFTGFNEIKLYNYQKEATEDFQKTSKNLSESSFKANFISGLLGPIVSLLTYSAIAISIYLGARNVLIGAMSVGTLQAFIRYIWGVDQPLKQMTQLSSAIQASFASMDRVFNFLDEEEQTEDIKDPVQIESYQGAVSFDNVSFGYSDVPVLKDLSVDIKPGQMAAIVGPTGAGKTTIINLLMRFYDVDKGAILIDGVDIRDMKRDDLRSLFGMVLQDTWLFSGKIKDNIAYGKRDATMPEIIDVAKRANIHHFIKTQPDGYNMVLNEESSNVSNGEKQLLTIARALLSDPKILILDEATSSVDTRLDAMIQEAMAELTKNRTSFVIAHRLSTIRNADVILVVKDGDIIEKGKHDELIEQNGFYADLYNSQFADS
ncbi:MAG: ABC transporter ATP-binding protein [Erysipelothrix sp.]|nr:ABC transporter ATP-binding protein [Erysipelothrix sp.]